MLWRESVIRGDEIKKSMSKKIRTIKIEKIDHIGILVGDINTVTKIYSIMGLKPTLIEENKTYNVKIAFLPVGGVLIELLEPIGPGRLEERLKNYGEGIDHIAFKVDNLERALQKLKAQGIPLQDENPQPGGAGAKVAFLKREGVNGVSIELKEEGNEKDII